MAAAGRARQSLTEKAAESFASLAQTLRERGHDPHVVAHFADLACDLFRVMASGGRVGFETVDWCNGGLFDDDTALTLERSDIDTVLVASRLDWSEIDPSILGTLFERGLDPGKLL